MRMAYSLCMNMTQAFCFNTFLVIQDRELEESGAGFSFKYGMHIVETEVEEKPEKEERRVGKLVIPELFDEEKKPMERYVRKVSDFIYCFENIGNVKHLFCLLMR